MRGIWFKIKRFVKTYILNNFYRQRIESLPDVPLPQNESRRLQALKGLNLVDTPNEERFDRITETAAEMFDMSISFITLVDANKQWFKSCYGTELKTTDKKISFCAYAILKDQVFVIPDTKKDKRFKDFPIVTGVANIRFYAGAPIAAPDGSLVGTLCLLDHHPRIFSDHDKKLLQNLAKWAELEINSKSTSNALSQRRKAQKALEEQQTHLEQMVAERTVSLQEALASAESLKTLRDRIIRIISHQLRTPMNAIRWNLELLLSGKLGALKKEQKEFVKLVYDADVAVINRLHDLLKTLDIEQNKILFNNEPIELLPLVQSVVVEKQVVCDFKQMKILLKKPRRKIPLVVADPEKLHMVLERILDNAINYSKNKQNVQVKISIKKTGVAIIIKDQGVGIPSEEQSNIFTRFFRASNAHTMQPDGSGLALYVSHYYVEQMGGELTLTSVVNQGTEVQILLQPEQVKNK